MNVTPVNYQKSQNSPNFSSKLFITRIGAFHGGTLGDVIPYENEDGSIIIRVLRRGQIIDDPPEDGVVNFPVNSKVIEDIKKLYMKVAKAVHEAIYTTGDEGVDLTDLSTSSKELF